MKVLKDIYYLNDGNPAHQLDLYIPDTSPCPVFVYFHGGGLESGTKSDINKIFEALAEKGIAVASANYRMYPSAVFPEYLRDAAAAVGWAYKNMASYCTVSKFFVGGSSAGGYLSQMLCFDKKYLAPYGIDPDQLGGFVHDSGQPTTHFNVLRERGIDYRRTVIDDAAPLYHVTEGRNYAPMQIIVAEHDMLNRLEQTQLLLAALSTFDYEKTKLDYRFMKGYTHCAYICKQDETGAWPFADMIAEFIKKEEKRTDVK